MNRLIALITALCLALLPLTAAADFTSTLKPLTGYTLRASDEELLIFANTSVKSRIVETIFPDTQPEISVFNVEGDWCYVGLAREEGMVYGYMPLTCFDLAVKPTPTPKPGPSYVPGTIGWVLNSAEGYRLNLRNAPYSTATSLGKYYTGTPVTLTGLVTDGFAQVLLAGMTLGWVDVRFITLDAAALVPETPMVTVQNPGSGATLRSGPDTSYNRIGWYTHGTTVTILGVRSDGWYHVVVEDKTGFMSDSLLSGTFPSNYGADSDHPAQSDHMANGEEILYINTRSAGGQLHLRKSASSSAGSVGLFYTGTPVTIVSYTRTGWAYVRIGQTEGYMAADYLASSRPTQYGVKCTIRNSRANGLNLRSLPSTGGEVLTFAENYSEVILLGELSDSWCYVQYGDQLGYMLGTSLEKLK